MEPIDRSRLETVSAQQRGSKVGTPDFAVPVEPSKGMAEFFDSLPATGTIVCFGCSRSAV